MRAIVSVGMPVYNGERFVEQAIDSILAQTFTNFELVISDNASDDRTAEICQRHAARDSRIRYIRQGVNIGAPRNFNFVFHQSGGQYFKWAAANDICAPTLVEACKAVLDCRPDVVSAFAKTALIDEQGQVFKEHEDNLAVGQARASERFIHVVEHMQLNNIHAGLFRAHALRKTGLEPRYPSGDLVMIAALSLYGRFFELPERLFYRRLAPGTATPYLDKGEIDRLHYPSGGLRMNVPLCRRWFGYVGAVLRSSVDVNEKRRAVTYLLKRLYWYRKSYLNELRESFL